MNKIKITITPQDANKARNFTDNQCCLLGTAIQRQLGLTPNQFSVGGSCVRLEPPNFVRGNYYTHAISKRGQKNLSRAYGGYSFGHPQVKKSFSVTLFPL